MKLVLLLAAGALAVQDTTPPVISLHLSESTTTTCNAALNEGLNWHNDNQEAGLNCAAPCFACDARDRNGQTAQAVTCEVGTDVTSCPEPVAHAHDSFESVTEDPDVTKTYVLVNDNNAASGATVGTVTCASGAGPADCGSNLNRNLRSEWLIRYTAQDLSGNAADEVSFTMIFQDTQAPLLITEFGRSGPKLDRSGTEELHYDVVAPRRYDSGSAPETTSDRSFAESCSEMGGSWATEPCTGCEPCTHTLKTGAAFFKAIDRYECVDWENENCSSGGAVATSQDTLRIQLVGPGETLDKASAKSFAALVADAANSWTVNTQHLGEWKVGYWANDHAEEFGFGETSNAVSQTVSIHITDNYKPIMELNEHGADDLVTPSDGHAAIKIECNRAGSVYVEPQAKCFDARESWNPNLQQYSKEEFQPNEGATYMDDKGTVLFTGENKDVNTYTLTYTCDDGHDGADHDLTALGTPSPVNDADNLQRVITVIDTRPPVIELQSGRQSYVQNSAGEHNTHAAKDDNHELGNNLDMETFQPDAEVQCTDTCTETPAVVATLYTGDNCGKTSGAKYEDGNIQNFPEYLTGHYSILYVCTDGASPQTVGDGETQRNTDDLCVHIENVDWTKPVLQLLGADEMTLEATHEGNYVDDGATCFDQVDGVISQNVEVSGDVVNLSKVGTYVIQYGCRDSKGNTASPLQRVVHVTQTSCPRCTLGGSCGDAQTDCSDGASRDCACTQDHEASFTYTDAGIACSDLIDGDLPASMVEIKVGEAEGAAVDITKTGTYVVTYRAHNSALLYSDFETCEDGAQHYFRTVNVKDTLKPVVKIHWKGQLVGESAEDPDALDRAAHDAGKVNPAYSNWQAGPFDLMAEAAQQRAGAWGLAAAAAAVAGLALLAHGSRRSTTTVPV